MKRKNESEFLKGGSELITILHILDGRSRRFLHFLRQHVEGLLFASLSFKSGSTGSGSVLISVTCATFVTALPRYYSTFTLCYFSHRVFVLCYIKSHLVPRVII